MSCPRLSTLAAIALALISMGSAARADLIQREVLLVYNSLDDESSRIATAYMTAHPGVRSLDLQLDYADFLPQSYTNPICNACNTPPCEGGCVGYCCSCPTFA